jgi:hypothetical protein
MSTYPSEIWPGDVTIELLDGTTDPATGLPYIPKGTGPTSSPTYEVQYNRRLLRQNQILSAVRQGMVVDEGNLTIGVYPIDFTLGGVHRTFAGATGVAVPDDSNRVIYLDAGAALQVQPSWPSDPTTYLPLAILGTSGGQLTLVDVRAWSLFHVPSIEATVSRDRRVLTVHRESVGTNQSDVEIYAFSPPVDVVLEEVQVFCRNVVATAGVDVKADSTSLLSAAATPLAGTIVKPAIANGSVSSASELRVHVTTTGSGTFTDLTVTLLLASAIAS